MSQLVVLSNLCDCAHPIALATTYRFNLDKASLAAGWKQELLGEAHVPESHEYGITSFVYKSTTAFHPQRLWVQALEQKAVFNNVLRSKGFFWIASHPDLVWEWSTAGNALLIMRPLHVARTPSL